MRITNAAAVLTCVRNRPHGITIPQVVTELVAAPTPTHAWEALHGNPDVLFSDPTPPTDPFRDSAPAVEDWARAGLTWVSVLDPDYPRRLLGVHDAPPFLFYRGNLAAADRGGMSIVGTRSISAEGAARATDAAEHLASREVPVISGLAAGVDTIAHTTALTHHATPIGVIATPITGPFTPAANRPLHEHVAHHGVLLSQFSPATRTAKSSFIQRNATMSGLGLATIIIEAGEQSGTRSQARFAQAHGRPVILSERVAETTTWGKSLAASGSRSVWVVSSRDDLHSAINDVLTIATLDVQSLIETQFA